MQVLRLYKFVSFILFLLIYFFNFFIFERAWVGARHKEEETEDLKWALCSQQQARCRAQTQKLQDHDLSWSQMLNKLSHPGAPKVVLCKRSMLTCSVDWQNTNILLGVFFLLLSVMTVLSAISKCIFWFENVCRGEVYSLFLRRPLVNILGFEAILSLFSLFSSVIKVWKQPWIRSKWMGMTVFQ